MCIFIIKKIEIIETFELTSTRRSVRALTWISDRKLRIAQIHFVWLDVELLPSLKFHDRSSWVARTREKRFRLCAKSGSCHRFSVSQKSRRQHEWEKRKELAKNKLQICHMSRLRKAIMSEQQDEEEWEFHSEFLLLATPHWGFTLDVTLMEIDIVDYRQRHKMFSPPTNQWNEGFWSLWCDLCGYSIIINWPYETISIRIKSFLSLVKSKAYRQFWIYFCVSESGIRHRVLMSKIELK